VRLRLHAIKVAVCHVTAAAFFRNSGLTFLTAWQLLVKGPAHHWNEKLPHRYFRVRQHADQPQSTTIPLTRRRRTAPCSLTIAPYQIVKSWARTSITDSGPACAWLILRISASIQPMLWPRPRQPPVLLRCLVPASLFLGRQSAAAFFWRHRPPASSAASAGRSLFPSPLHRRLCFLQHRQRQPSWRPLSAACFLRRTACGLCRSSSPWVSLCFFLKRRLASEASACSGHLLLLLLFLAAAAAAAASQPFLRVPGQRSSCFCCSCFNFFRFVLRAASWPLTAMR